MGVAVGSTTRAWVRHIITLSYSPSLTEQGMASLCCLTDFENFARSKLKSNAWGYYSAGANEEQTLKDNQEAFHRYIKA